MSKQTITTIFIIFAVGAIATHSVVRRLHFNQGITIIEVIVLIVMGLILLFWLFRIFSAIVARRQFVLNLTYPVNIPESPKISIIVPARNEERNIRRCLENLQKVEYPKIEIFAVNDRSTDRTGEIIAEIAPSDRRIKSLQGSDLPDGWVGKIHAIHQAVSHATGDWFLFIDADVAIHKKAPAIALSYCLKNDLKMLSIFLRPSLKTFWENIIMPVVFGSILFSFPIKKVNNSDDPTVMASGGFILINAESYRAIGGHEAIKNLIIEDVNLARLAKESDVPYHFVLGPEMGTQRWYTKFREMWQSWSKNLFIGMDCQISKTVQAVLMVFILSVLPFIVLLDQSVAPVSKEIYHSPLFWLALVQVIIILGYRFCDAVYQGYAKGYFFTHPLGSLVFIGIIINSAFRSLTGRGAIWKGRTYT